ncbi:MAG TPA: DUF3570 domain-containing protein [Steroidobacteraceae bacterium]|jgi:hypothetical protein|nr:DUF3570 domain-containing protein [Steroidobacteraceae bacterium]
MQLKPKISPAKTAGTRRRLMAASCALLSAGAARSQEASAAPAGSGLLEDWSVDSALAYYHEDGRVQAIEPVVNVSKIFADGQSLSFNATFDALSGASPNGALPSHSAQTFTSPSGKAAHAYTIAPGQLPADPRYSDTRFAAGGNWTLPLTRADQLSVGAKFSVEDDFVSGTVDASIAHDFNHKNTTLSFGLFNEYDSLHPVGDTPVPGSDFASLVRTGGKSKDGVGALLGVTQVMTRTWLSEFNLSVDRFTGYLNDPYKITSIIDSAGNPTGYEFESRPDQRTRKSAYWENRVAWTPQLSTALSLRHMSDDWAVRSDTAQLHLRWSWSNREQYIEPSFRWYRQTAADFYTPFILDTARQSTGFESADSRLGAFRALTYGVKYAHKLAGLGTRTESEFSVRAEYYQQTFNEQVPVPAGLQGLDLFPGLKAILVQFGYRF